MTEHPLVTELRVYKEFLDKLDAARYSGVLKNLSIEPWGAAKSIEARRNLTVAKERVRAELIILAGESLTEAFEDIVRDELSLNQPTNH